MARMSRAELFDPGRTVVVHVMNRVVRRCFLMGDDPVSGKNFDHRKSWIEGEIKRAAGAFAIDVIAFALMSNHLHMILRSRPDVVETWDDTEIARRWLQLCPKRKNKDGSPRPPSEAELNSIRLDPDKLCEIRSRLSDISWWMRLICQRIAQRANAEDGERGKFWQARFHAVLLLDEAAILACAAYVDLNPIRAAVTETLEHSEFTSIQRRLRALARDPSAAVLAGQSHPLNPAPSDLAAPNQEHQCATRDKEKPDSFLSPVQIDEQHGASGPLPSASAARCSDKGFTSLSAAEYSQLLDWTARRLTRGKQGITPAETPPVFERLEIRMETWCELVRNFEDYFSLVAGQLQQVENFRSQIRGQRCNLKARTRELLAS